MNIFQTSKPEISVVMSCYNGESWIADSIKSVLNQTFKDFEFIIVDDGSTDNSLSIIKEFANIDSRIIVISKKNTGLTNSLNVGLNLSKGKWTARIDVDDLCEPSRFEEQLLVANSNPNFIFVGSGFYIIDEKGDIKREYRCLNNHQNLVDNLYNSGFFPPHSSAFFRTDEVKKIGGYRERIKRAQDWDLWLRLSCCGLFTAVEKPLVRIRKHSLQVSNEDSGNRQVIDCTIGTVSSLIRNLGGNDPVDSSSEEFEKFREWIVEELIKNEFLGYHAFLADARRIRMTQSQNIYWLPNLILFFLKNPKFLCRFLARKSENKNFFHSLSLQWQNKKRIK